MRNSADKPRRIFADDGDVESRGVVLPWKRTFHMCWSNVLHRLGRSILSFACITVVIAFFSSSVAYQDILAELSASDDVHTCAVLERAGVVTHDAEQLARQRDQRVWLMSLSGFLCLVGITNTILMSVTERFREIGTLKCLGALDSFIIRLFLIESAFIGLLGSLTGSLLGYLLALLQVGAVLEFSLLTWGNAFGALAASLPIALGAGTVLTIVAAVYPTYVAARMKPTDAMRVEI